MKNVCWLPCLGAIVPLFCALFFPSLKAMAEPEIQPFTANYRAYHFGVAIDATRTLKRVDEKTMQLSFRTDTFFIDINERSTFMLPLQAPLSLMPMEYHYHRTGIGKNRHVQLTFDWPATKIFNQRTNTQLSIPENTVVFDKLNYQLQLQYDLMNGKTEFDYSVVDGQQLKNYRFRIVGEESLMTEVGELATVKVERVRDHDKRTTDIWFATDWNYLLVQLEQREKDSKKYRIQLANAIVNGVDVTGK